jgi:hypothetical protein
MLLTNWSDTAINETLSTLTEPERTAIDIWSHVRKTETRPGVKTILTFAGETYPQNLENYEAALASGLKNFREFWASRGVNKVDDLGFAL